MCFRTGWLRRAALAALAALAWPLLGWLRREWRRRMVLPSLVFDYENDYALVFSMIKVGSTSLWVGMGSYLELWNYYDKLNETYGILSKTHYPHIAHDFVKKVPPGKRIWIFTGVRNPMARLVSGYFEDIEQKRHMAHLTEEEILAMDMKDMQWDFLRNYTLDVRDNWFSSDLNALAGVDLTKYSFPFNEGRLIVEGMSYGRPIIVVMLRAEDVEYWWDIMRLHVPSWTVDHKQDSKELWYGAKYAAFKKSFRWPSWALDVLIRADSQKFFTIAERAKMFRVAALGPSWQKVLRNFTNARNATNVTNATTARKATDASTGRTATSTESTAKGAVSR
mmetsp:Transcript_100082/g.311833  ORF Transcript_100082/g.311833 Transcript_100082/m.311833 type:complete len:336 (+) Transcript_100082:92-1099(+)